MTRRKLFHSLVQFATPTTLALVALLLPISPSAKAAHAVFSADQLSVFLTASDTSGTLRILNAETSEICELTFPEIAQAPEKPEIQAISPGKNGGFWLLTEKSLWRWDGRKASARKVADAPEGVTFEDVAAQRDGEGSQVITGRLARQDEWGRTGCLFFKRDAQGPLLKVFVRRLDEIECPVYLDDGSLLFGAEGDLWHGKVDFDPGEKGGAGYLRLIVMRHWRRARLTKVLPCRPVCLKSRRAGT